MARKAAATDKGKLSYFLLMALQGTVFLVGIAGATLHAVPREVHEEHQNWPVLDLVTMAWVGLAIFAWFIPNIDEFKVGELSVKLRAKVEKVSEGLDEITDSLANLAQNWSTSMALFSGAMDDPNYPEPKDKTYRDYVRDRMGEGLEMLSRDPDETLSVAFWLYDQSTSRIEFASAVPTRMPTRTSYALGEGMLGKAFLERRHFNEADVRHVPSYLNTREGKEPPYRAVLCEPVWYGNEVIGMITVDSSKVGFFDRYAEDIAKGLGAQCALSTMLYRRATPPERDKRILGDNDF